MCSLGAYIAALMPGFWIFAIAYGKTIPPLVLGASALYAFSFVLRSRLAERKLNKMRSDDPERSNQVKHVQNLLAFSALFPNWILALILISLTWSFFVLLRDLLAQVCAQ
ncbi:hypothetical protein [Planktotalea arctica]|uniref:hypothetical protein n=1 Tax=Planktotalea arctica TaxID=1481893 RepID=UPI000A17831F|nr:hypothetical protein [Planktotalea arctica]